LVGEDGKAVYDEGGFRDTWCSYKNLSGISKVRYVVLGLLVVSVEYLSLRLSVS